ncbi:unnamed protein product [Adineta ricciae]|nr:unnamed protein product [Adineta ricciae]
MATISNCGTTKRKPRLDFDDHSYIVDRSKGEKTYWRCIKYSSDRSRSRLHTCNFTTGRSFRRLDPLKSEWVPIQLFSIPAGIAQEISDQFLTVASSKFEGNSREMTGTYV